MVGADCCGFRGYDLQEGSGLQDEKADIGGGLLVPVYEELLDGYYRNDLDGFGSWWRVYSSLPHISHALTALSSCRWRIADTDSHALACLLALLPDLSETGSR